MTNDVSVSVKEMKYEQMSVENAIETITKGQYYFKNNMHYVTYEDMIDEFSGPTKNLLKFNDTYCALTKKGAANVNMIFEKHKKNLTNYGTPYGDIVIGIETSKVQVMESEKKIKVGIQYALEINYEHLADCEIGIEIGEKNTFGL